MIRTKTDIFVDLFNSTIPGAEPITKNDVLDLRDCGLVAKYGYYSDSDLETVRAILQFERLRPKRQKVKALDLEPNTRKCNMCGDVIVIQAGKIGRPKEYCDKCAPFRSNYRYKKWAKRQKFKQKRLTEINISYN